MSSIVWFPGKMYLRQRENQGTVPKVGECLASIRSKKETCERMVGRDKVRGWGWILLSGSVKGEIITHTF